MDKPSRSIVEPILACASVARRASHSPRVEKLAVSKRKISALQKCTGRAECYKHHQAQWLFAVDKQKARQGYNQVKMLATSKLTVLVNIFTDYRKRLGRSYMRRMNQRITTALRHNYTTLHYRPSTFYRLTCTNSQNY